MGSAGSECLDGELSAPAPEQRIGESHAASRSPGARVSRFRCPSLSFRTTTPAFVTACRSLTACPWATQMDRKSGFHLSPPSFHSWSLISISLLPVTLLSSVISIIILQPSYWVTLDFTLSYGRLANSRGHIQINYCVTELRWLLTT